MTTEVLAYDSRRRAPVSLLVTYDPGGILLKVKDHSGNTPHSYRIDSGEAYDLGMALANLAEELTGN